MSTVFRLSRRGCAALLLALALTLVFSLCGALRASAASLVQLSSDPYTNTTSQHQTEVEPDTYSSGSTIVAAVQVGRFYDGGASNIGWATSTNGGSTWTHGFLPGTTPYSTPAGPYARLSDPAVAYDPAHHTWLIASLALSTSGSSVYGAAVIVNLSTDGGLTWSNPVVVQSAGSGAFFDKDWIACDTKGSSPYYGHCYVEWDDNGNGNLILMSTLINGGSSWGAALTTANHATGIGGQPLVQPNGTVIVPIDDAGEGHILSFTSTNGGSSWGSTVTVATIHSFTDSGRLRSGPLPSAEINGAGKVFVVWEDCRFESGCSANDIVMSTSKNGTTWSAVKRIPIDAVGSHIDHFLPGIAVDPHTKGTSTHLALVYYYYPTASCSVSTCKLDVGFVSSTNGGSSWSAPTQLAGPMTVTWLASTDQGYMVGDYMSTSISNGLAFPGIVVASAPSGGVFQEGLYTASGLSLLGGTRTSDNDRVVFTGSLPARTGLPTAF